MRSKKMLFLAATLVLCSISATASADEGGFWCWTHRDGKSALCGREEWQCEASRKGFNDAAKALGEPQITEPCTWRKTAWELVTKRPVGPGHHYPTKKLCLKVRDKGESCRLAR